MPSSHRQQVLPTELWPRVEAFRRRAERLEGLAAAGSYAFRRDMARLAVQCRALAVQAQAVAEWTAIGLAARAWSPSSLYLFYLRHEDGSYFTFEAHNCADDGEALARAEQVLHQHSSSVEVVVWLGDRRIGSCSASGATSPLALEAKVELPGQGARRSEYQ